MKRRDEVLVGILTLVTIGALVAGMVYLSRGGLSSGYPIYAKFPWGSGLKQGQPVQFSGVNLGFVDGVELIQTGGLVVTLRIYKTQKVPVGSVASVEPNGIFGDMLIALRPMQPPNGQFLEPGDTIPSGPSAPGLGTLMARMDTVGGSVSLLIKDLHQQLIGDRVIASMHRTVRTADSLLAVVTRLVQTQSAELTKTQESVRTAIAAVDKAQVDSTMRSMRDATLHATALMDSLSSTNNRVKSLLTKLESGDGTMAKLINDPKFFNEATATLTQLKELMADFKLNPGKYIRLSIF